MENQTHTESVEAVIGQPVSVPVAPRRRSPRILPPEEERDAAKMIKNMIASARLLERLRCLHGKDALSDKEDAPRAPVLGDLRIRSIQAAVCYYYAMNCDNDVTIIDMCSTRRTKAIIEPRQVAQYLCCRFTTHSLPEIGKMFGNKDHTAVLHNRNKIERQIKNEPRMAAIVGALILKIQQVIASKDLEAA